TGTDHGSQGPMFVIGGGVQGGVYGRHPNINQGAQDDDGNTPYTQSSTINDPMVDPYRSTDLRDVFGTILAKWVKMQVSDVQTLFPLDSTVIPLNQQDDTNHYWNAANFGMGFL